MSSTPDQRGAAVVEFALLVPILLLLLFGIIEFGRGYNVRTTLTHAAREAVRVVAVGDGDASAAAQAAAPALDSSQLTVTVSASPCVPGEPVTVTVTYPFRYTIPLFGEGTLTLTERGTMRCGG